MATFEFTYIELISLQKMVCVYVSEQMLNWDGSLPDRVIQAREILHKLGLESCDCKCRSCEVWK